MLYSTLYLYIFFFLIHFVPKIIFRSMILQRKRKWNFSFFFLSVSLQRLRKKIFFLAGDGGGAGGDGDSMVGGGNSEKKNTEYETNLFLYSVSKIYISLPSACTSINRQRGHPSINKLRSRLECKLPLNYLLTNFN